MKKSLLPIILLLAYVAILIKVMVFKDVPLIRVGGIMLNFGGTNAGHSANFLPFTTIVPYLFGSKGLIIGGINLLGNIILLVPVGILLPFVFRTISWKKSVLVALASGLIIEVLQVLLHVGIFDIDDVILNALGVMIGYWKIVILSKWIREKKYLRIIIAAALAIMVIVSCIVAFNRSIQKSMDEARSRGIPSGREDGAQTNATSDDLCGGTGGNGGIVNLENAEANRSFAMSRNEGGKQIIRLSKNAVINTSAGVGSISDLKLGDRITLVGGPNSDGSFTADAIFVCKK